MEFDCRYSKPNGDVVREVYVGQTVEEVRARIRERGFLPLSVKPKLRSLPSLGRAKGKGFTPQDFIAFNQQFVALIRAGLPILRSLDLLRNRIANSSLRSHVETVRDRVHSGIALSEALEEEGVFPKVYTASVFAGERSGNLEEVIQRYIRYEKTILSAGKKFRNSLIYPAFLVVLSIVMVGVILGYVIPRFAELYEGLGAVLPFPDPAVDRGFQSHTEQFDSWDTAGGRILYHLQGVEGFGGRTRLDRRPQIAHARSWNDLVDVCDRSALADALDSLVGRDTAGLRTRGRQ